LKHILVVDDEKQITRMLRASLQSSGYEVTTADNGLEALEKFSERAPDLVITDLAMPEMTGIELTGAIRRISQIPVLVLSVRDSDAMKVAALDEGANDYVTKPFSMPELLARVRVQLRAARHSVTEPEQIATGDFAIDKAEHSVRLRGERVRLTPKEFDLLWCLALQPRRVFTHKTLLRAIWGPGSDHQPEYLRVLVGQLRKKIEPPGSPTYIQSEPWVGYRFLPDGKDEFTDS
jgi:two-component system KDP operon response regulator KdpE